MCNNNLTIKNKKGKSTLGLEYSHLLIMKLLRGRVQENNHIHKLLKNYQKRGEGKMKKLGFTAMVLAACIVGAVLTNAAWAADASDLAKKAQNPIADMISLPLQNNLNFNYGPEREPQNILNVQPVIPFKLSSDWNLITRTIMPLISQPGFAPGQDTQFGLGDIQFSAFLSPAESGKLIWGVGAVAQLPTHTDSRLGSNQWGLGPTVVALRIEGPWVYGALVNNIWSLGSSSESGAYNNFLLQPFCNYNFGKTGTYLTFAPIATANWKTGDWVVPLGGGVGQIFKIFGKQPVNAQLSSYYNVARPENLGPEWQMRLQVQFLFPK